jgi:hypothetical protein
VSADRRKNENGSSILTMCTVLASGEDSDTYGLRGISSVPVVIEPLGANVANIGLAEDAVRTDVELRLRSAGLRVISPSFEEEKKGGHLVQFGNNGSTALDTYLDVSVTVTPDGLAAAMAVKFMQVAHLARNNSQVAGATWFAEAAVPYPKQDSVRSALKRRRGSIPQRVAQAKSAPVA